MIETLDLTLNLKWISQKRKVLGLSQVALAHLAGISLPTLQNIEAGRANPSIDILQKLLSTLQIKIIFKPVELDVSLLCTVGLPLLDISMNQSISRTRLKGAKTELRRALDQLLSDQINEPRLYEALIAFMAAMRDHYPSCFNIYADILSSKHLDQRIKKMELGRFIKLRRLALARFGWEYLR